MPNEKRKTIFICLFLLNNNENAFHIIAGV